MTTFGQRGGEGPTAGMTARRFRVTFPDGTRATKRSFRHFTGEPVAYCYQHAGKWYVAAVNDASYAQHMGKAPTTGAIVEELP